MPAIRQRAQARTARRRSSPIAKASRQQEEAGTEPRRASEPKKCKETQDPIWIRDASTNILHKMSCKSCIAGHRAPQCGVSRHPNDENRIYINRPEPGRPAKTCPHGHIVGCRCIQDREIACQLNSEQWTRLRLRLEVSAHMWPNKEALIAHNQAHSVAHVANTGQQVAQAYPVLAAPAPMYVPAWLPHAPSNQPINTGNYFGAGPSSISGTGPSNTFAAGSSNNFGLDPSNNFGLDPSNTFLSGQSNNFGPDPFTTFLTGQSNNFGPGPSNTFTADSANFYMVNPGNDSMVNPGNGSVVDPSNDFVADPAYNFGGPVQHQGPDQVPDQNLDSEGSDPSPWSSSGSDGTLPPFDVDLYNQVMNGNWVEGATGGL